MATEGTIRNIVRTLDRFDAHLDAMKEDDAKSLLGKLKKLVKTFDIPMNKVSEGARKPAPPPTKEVNNKTSTSNRKSNTDKEKTVMATATNDVMPKAERSAYAEAHGIKLKGSPEVQTEQVKAHQKHFNALIKKGAERLLALGNKNVEGFKVDGRIKSEDKRAAAAADLILAAGYVPAGKGIAKPEEDEAPVKKTTSKKAPAPEVKTSKKTEAKKTSEKSSKKTRKVEDDEDEEDEDEAPVKVKKTKKVKHVEEAPAKKVKKAKVEEAPVKKTKKTKEDKVSSKKKVKRSRD